MKGVRLLIVLVLVMLGILVSPVFAASTAKIMAAERTKLYENVSIIKIDPILENATPYWIIIAAGSTEKGRKVIFEYIDSSNLLKEKEKVFLKKSIVEIWGKYHVKVVKKGNVTLITLEIHKLEPMIKSETVVLEKITHAVNEYFEEKYVKNRNVGIKWNADTHQDIIYIACRKWEVDNDLCVIVRDHADDPDQWTQITPPPGYPDWMWNFIIQIVHSWTHYYNPSYCLPTTPPICFPAGGAPGETKTYANKAKNYYSSGKYNTEFENLGYASHFLTDVGNPFHTGAELRQVVFSNVHYAYEGYVSSNWNSGYKFRNVVSGVPVHHYVSITDPEKATKDLASNSHLYADTLFWEIILNKDTWQSSPTVKAITENCLQETARYTLGLVRYMIT